MPPLTKPDDIISITPQNLGLIKPEWLSDDGLVWVLKLFVLDTFDSADSAVAGNAFKVLYDLIGKVPKLVNERPDLFREYLRMLAILKSCLLITMTDEEVAEFIKDDLLLTLEVSDVEVEDKIAEVFLPARGFPIRIDDLRGIFLRAIEDNNEFLGAEGLVIKGQEEAKAPTVRNWLAIYRQVAASLGEPSAKIAKRGGLERSGFITQNENVRKLSKDEQAILLRLLEFYDWLQFGVGKEEVVERPLQKVEERRASSLPAGVALEAFKQRIEGGKSPAPGPKAPTLTPQEIKREVTTPELPSPDQAKYPVLHGRAKEVPSDQLVPKRQSTSPPAPLLQGEGRMPTPSLKPLPPDVAAASKAPLPKLGLRSLAEIKIMDDLKKIELMHLRQGSLQNQISNIKNQISKLAAANKVLPYYAVTTFEQSPIFKTYLEVGGRNLAKERTGAAPSYDPLTQAEFEAIADLRRQIESL